MDEWRRLVFCESFEEFKNTGRLHSKQLLIKIKNQAPPLNNRLNNSIAEATKAAKPTEPIVFLKPYSSLIAEGQSCEIPKIWKSVNFEAELGVLIGKDGVNISESDAMSYVGGYCLALDMTGTEYLKDARVNNKPWSLGKSFATATPVSRFVSKDEIPDVNNLRVWSKLNGEMKQDDTTAGFIFDVRFLQIFLETLSNLLILDSKSYRLSVSIHVIAKG